MIKTLNEFNEAILAVEDAAIMATKTLIEGKVDKSIDLNRLLAEIKGTICALQGLADALEEKIY